MVCKSPCVPILPAIRYKGRTTTLRRPSLHCEVLMKKSRQLASAAAGMLIQGMHPLPDTAPKTVRCGVRRGQPHACLGGMAGSGGRPCSCVRQPHAWPRGHGRLRGEALKLRKSVTCTPRGHGRLRGEALQLRKAAHARLGGMAGPDPNPIISRMLHRSCQTRRCTVYCIALSQRPLSSSPLLWRLQVWKLDKACS